MALVIGTDEAGYGPNLGPLVISATAWRVPDEALEADLYKRLNRSIARPGGAAEARGDRLLVGDSKLVYKAGAGLAQLELGVLSLLHITGECPASWSAIWRYLLPACDGHWLQVPWYCGFDLELPAACTLDEICAARDRCRAAFSKSGIELVAIRSRAIFPTEWNGLLDGGSGKGEILSQATLRLVAEVLAGCDDAQVLVHCDKHGGRNRYAALLNSVFPDNWVHVRHEGRAESRYRIQCDQQQLDFRFVTQGEGHLACALASMTSKYLRELAMRAFNAYWCERIPGLRPTAGYPTDAQRFRGEIAAEQQRLGIGDTVLWRVR